MSSTPTPQLHLPTIAGRYSIQRKLGSGSMGAVYLALDDVERRLVALKVIRTERLIADPVSRMQEEFRAIVGLRHPRIAAAYDFGYIDEGGVPFYTREYVQGKALPQGPPGQSAPQRFLRPILDVLESLEYLHDCGVLHLDIHAGNLIVAEDTARGSVLIDIGWRPRVEISERRLSSARWSSLPPEMVRGGSVSERTDLFLVGRLLFQRLTGRSSGEPCLPREIPGWGTGRTLALERILAKALQSAPEQRFSSAAEFRKALSSAVGAERAAAVLADPPEATVGRDRELGAIEEALRQAASGRQASVWISGRNGVGKTRLLSEAKLRAQLRGLQTVEVRCFPDPGPTPAMRRALRGVRLESGSPGGWLEAITPQFGGALADRAQRAAEAFFTSDGKPLVITADDVDRADRESRALVEALAAEGVRRQRSGVPGRGLALFASSTVAPPSFMLPHASFRLEPLSKKAARSLLCGLLRNLKVPEELLRKALSTTERRPLLLRQIAVALRLRWSRSGVVPPGVTLPQITKSTEGTALDTITRLSEWDRDVLQALRVLDRPATRGEIAAAVDSSIERVAQGLRRLVVFEAVATHRRGRERYYQISNPEAACQTLESIPAAKEKLVHRRLLRFLEPRVADLGGARVTDAMARDLENIARHELAVGHQRKGREHALAAARLLRQRGTLDRAVALLEHAISSAGRLEQRLLLAEEICDILEEAGDHDKCIAVLAPLYESKGLPRRYGVRLRRRLGTNYHRGGAPEKALDMFQEASVLADPQRDLEELIFIDSELAEIHMFAGYYDEAMSSCLRGLRRIEERRVRDAFRGRVEVVLRASLGHVHLRRMDLRTARRELRRALRLCRQFGTLGDRAAILHNLGVVENHLSDFGRARRRFAEAERLLMRAGEQRNVLKISTNLALIAAKQGNLDEARMHLERARELLAHFPGQRLRCFFEYSRGVVSHLFGEVQEATDAFETATSLACELGDRSIGDFARAYLAEVHLSAGRYSKALALLRSLEKRVDETTPLVLRRMVWSRLLVVESLLGRRRAASRARTKLEETERSDIDLLEAWNDLFLALARGMQGEPSGALIDDAVALFRRVGVPVGEQFSQLLRLLESLSNRSAPSVLSDLAELERIDDARHAFLGVALPLARAEACFFSGRHGQAEEHLSTASGAIVGCPFLELDWRIELLRARITLRKGQTDEARRHHHRALHSRDLLIQFVPGPAKRGFLEELRFRDLRELTERLRPGPRMRIREPDAPSVSQAGIIGKSEAMVRLFSTLESLGSVDVPILVRGETGTGKELVVRAIRDLSPRRHKPLGSVPCACLPAELFESELFGHVAGAFTGAEEDQPGLLRSLEGGTLLLDEISELSPESQAKLLRVLESGVVRPLGAVAAVNIDVRFIATTSEDPDDLVSSGRLRRDLLYRLRSFEIVVPPLRERREDIPLLAEHFLRQHAARLNRKGARLSPQAVDVLLRHDWRGNVRELESLMLRVLITLSPALAAVVIEERDLEACLQAPPRSPESRDLTHRSLDAWRADLEREYLTQLFQKLGGDIRGMMRELGVQRTKLYEWLRDLGIDTRELRRRL